MLTLPLYGTNSASTVAAQTSDWSRWASIGWRYFQPGVGVNPVTGLGRAKLDWDYATDWDLASNIMSVILAWRLGLIGDTTPAGWGFRDRIDKILNALEDRILGENRGVPWPYWTYVWDGSGCGVNCKRFTDSADSARLLVALDTLRSFDPSYGVRVQGVYERAREAYDIMANDESSGYYGYYYAKAYEAWGYNESASLQAFENLRNAPTVNVYGIQIPKVSTITEPTLLVLLELDRSKVSPTYLDFARQIYEVQMARYSSTGLLTAWSEGPYYQDPQYVYEAILNPSVSPQTWVITDPTGQVIEVSPLAYTKVAISYLALYGGQSSFGESLFSKMLNNPSSNLVGQYGFGEGTFENGTRPPFGSGFYDDVTNELVLASAAYALSAPTPTTTLTTLTTQHTTTTMSIATTSTPINELPLMTTGLTLASILIAALFAIAKSKRKRGPR